jgi:hypothetical protein
LLHLLGEEIYSRVFLSFEDWTLAEWDSRQAYSSTVRDLEQDSYRERHFQFLVLGLAWWSYNWALPVELGVDVRDYSYFHKCPSLNHTWTLFNGHIVR